MDGRFQMNWRKAGRFIAVAGTLAASASILACSGGDVPADVPSLSTANPGAAAQMPTVAGELLIRFENGVSPDEQQRFMEERGLSVTRRHFSQAYVSVAVPAGSEDALRE